MLELPARPIPAASRPIPAASREEAPAVSEQGWWDVACCPVPPGPQGPLKTSVQQNWPARQTGIMGMTQPKRRFTSSTQRGGRSSGGTWSSCSTAPLPEPAGQPGCRLGCLPEAPSQGCWARPLPLRRDALPARPAATLPPAWPPFRLDPGAQLPSGPGPGRGGRAGQGAWCWERLLQASAPFISPQPLPFLVPGVAAASGPAPCNSGFGSKCFSGEGHNGIHLLKACVSSLGQVASCSWTLSHWLRIGLQIRRKSA